MAYDYCKDCQKLKNNEHLINYHKNKLNIKN